MGRKVNPADLAPWIAMAIAGIGAILTAITKLTVAMKEFETRELQAKAALEYWKWERIKQKRQGLRSEDPPIR